MFDVGCSFFFSGPSEGPDVSWLDKSSSHESALSVIICVGLPGRSFSEAWSVANDRSSLFVVLHPYPEYEY